ncbi:MAG TPA: hypothetical protein VGZ02_11275 [Candidatus Baltobacteraceae bacterium]|jgi:anti-sigma factor ChrR (cupin superfamily)|nr:hypothetical protein [Candidatus Baltobacteraceae bacterium]
MNQSPDAHLGELADLYAIAALDEADARRVEAHAGVCETCRDALREAEAAALTLIEAGEMHDAPSALNARIASSARPARRSAVSSWMALAAAFILGAIAPTVWLLERNAATPGGSMQNAAIVAMVHSHFLHAPLRPLQAGAPQAKVIFPRDGSWIYVVIAAPADGMQVATVTGAGTHVLGAPSAAGSASAFYAQLKEKIDGVVLLQNGRAIARAAIASNAH